MTYYISTIYGQKDKLTLQNYNSLLKNDLIPAEMDQYKALPGHRPEEKLRVRSYCRVNEDDNVFYGTTTAATYTQCYLVDGSQANITHVSSNPASNFATLTSNLNGNPYHSWVQPSSTSAPVLSPYSE